MVPCVVQLVRTPGSGHLSVGVLLYVKHSSLKLIKNLKDKEANSKIRLVCKGRTGEGGQGLGAPGPELPPHPLPAPAGDLSLSSGSSPHCH